MGGEIEGYIGRFHEISVGKSLKLNNLVANYQDIYEYLDSTEINNRNGIIGNIVLSRFDVIIDYHKQKIYLKPNKYYKKSFKFDRSGLVFLASGLNFNTYTVNYVMPGSPADRAGVLVGDEVRKINWLPSGYLSLADLTRKLKGKVGKRITLKVIRNGKKIKKRFRLEDII